MLAFAVDAAEPTLIRRMIEQDEMPALKSLLSEGKWMSVKSPADIGSGSVWPSFLTGEDPTVHGVYGEWCWDPDLMGIERITSRHLSRFGSRRPRTEPQSESWIFRLCRWSVWRKGLRFQNGDRTTYLTGASTLLRSKWLISSQSR